MLRHHGRAAALALGGILAVALPAGFVLAASSHDAHGAAVSTVATSSDTTGQAHGDAVSTVARGSHGAPDTVDRGESASAPEGVPPTDTHGSAVSTVARDKSAVGGPNDNHGGAVSAVARQNAGAGGTPPTGHGTSVSTVAQSSAATGQAHGEAVAAAARRH